MKNKLINKVKKSSFLMLLMTLIVLSGCSDPGEGWADERYLSGFELYVDHVNPLTGVAYTEEELAELLYDPAVEERYAEGQDVVLDLMTAKLPATVNVLHGNDLSIIETITEFSEMDGKFKAKAFMKTLEELGLLEIGDIMTLRFDVVYVDGSIGSQYFEIGRIKFFDPGAIIDTFVYLQKSTGEKIPLLISENVTSRVESPEYGSIVEFDGAVNKVEVTDVADLDFRNDSDFSVGIWVNTTSSNDDPVMIGDKDWGSGGNAGFLLAQTGADWKLNYGDGSNRADINGIAVINDGAWHYLVATFDRDGSATVYQDGVNVGSTSIAGVTPTASGFPIHVGQDGTGGYGVKYAGNVGEVAIFDYVLTAEQVAGISTPRTGVKLQKQDGTIKNIPVSNSGGVVSVGNGEFAYEFNGVDQYATIADTELDFRHDSDYSISFWVNTTSGDSDPVMVGDQDWGSSSNDGITIAFRGSNWRTAYADGDGNKADIDHNSGFNDGAWHLLTVVCDRDGDMSMYVNGSKKTSTDMSAVGNSDSGNPLRLAQDGTGNYGQFFQGSIAGTVIYDYALTDEQVAALIPE